MIDKIQSNYDGVNEPLHSRKFFFFPDDWLFTFLNISDYFDYFGYIYGVDQSEEEKNVCFTIQILLIHILYHTYFSGRNGSWYWPRRGVCLMYVMVYGRPVAESRNKT